MGFDGEYGPSTWEWVADQAAEYEASNGQQANTLRDTGLPIIVMTTVGHKTGLVRKVPLMKVEHEGIYAIVASKGGAVNHPGWYHNLLADPTVLIQDGPEPFETTVRLATGGERAEWWDRSVAAYSPYADYQEKTDREIPLFLTETTA
ncbi:MAG TPA: nitroreductase family deazaflavin-dependent oxidoreductase [Acidimicrobiaceae bacterium]|nr:nitroreductase family deazaflavin-dependent oxidoreductase [Acidimicrobiaceae bacterium]